MATPKVLNRAFQNPWPYFHGRWCLARQIADHRRPARGRMSGGAVFTPVPTGLDYRESCIMTLAGQDIPATQSYRFVFGKAAEATIRFEDGRLFHKLDLSTGRADVKHDCPPDQYRGRYRIRSANLWTLTWVVTGPRKRMVLHTRFTRGCG